MVAAAFSGHRPRGGPHLPEVGLAGGDLGRIGRGGGGVPRCGGGRLGGGSVMSRLARTEGLTEVQREILGTIGDFTDREILPVATALEHADAYPLQIVEGLKKLGVFGLMIPEEFGGLGESLLTYALAVEALSRGWMGRSGIINTHFIVAYLALRHGTPEQQARLLPRLAARELRGAFSMSEPGCGADGPGVPTPAPPRAGHYWLEHDKAGPRHRAPGQRAPQ